MTEVDSPASELPAPAELGGFAPVRRLGEGADGRVFEVRSASGPLAVKLVWGAGPASPEAEARLQQQARALSLIAHPRLVRVLDLIPVGRNLCVVMELVAGPSLEEVLRQRRPRPEEIAVWMVQLAEAIDYLHLLGIVHRDVKPANVLLAPDGRVKLADLAVADLLRVQGTPAYMAPEVEREDRAVDGRADVYSLACVAYETLVGLPPFLRLRAGDGALLGRRSPPPDPGALIPGFPRSVAEILLGGLAPRPAERPATAGAFAAALSDAMGTAPTPTTQALAALVPRDDEALRTRPAPLPRAPEGAWPLPRRIAELPIRAPLPRPVLIAIVVLFVIATGALGYTGYAVYQHVTAVPPPLRVIAVSFTSSPTQVTVPTCATKAVFRFQATAHTNGRAGSLRYQWTDEGQQMDGLSGQVAVPAGRTQVAFSATDQTYPGADTTQLIVLQVMSPNHLTSKAVTVSYRCS